MLNVILHTLPKCAQCQVARKLLEQLAMEQPFRFKEINLESNDTLWRMYNLDAPVLFVNGLKSAQYWLTIKILRLLRQKVAIDFHPLYNKPILCTQTLQAVDFRPNGFPVSDVSVQIQGT